jgi:hypothetical protein
MSASFKTDFTEFFNAVKIAYGQCFLTFEQIAQRPSDGGN